MAREEERACAGEPEGARAAAALLRLGKFGRPIEEVLVIEALEVGSSCRRPPRQDAALHAHASKEAKRCQEDEEGPAAVEGDLLLQDCDSEEEAYRLPGSMPRHWAPGSREGRRLMQSRAQQCVVCMEEKEHTFVPPHRDDAGKHVDGHRFCTDCWAEFLQHGLQRIRTAVPPPLACPVCRGSIEVPDVWALDFDLPDSWTQAASSSAFSAPSSPNTGATPSSRFFWGRFRATPGSEAETSGHSWADVAPGLAGTTAPEPVLEDEECTPVGRLSGGAPPSRWRALACPVPTWHTGGYIRRLCEAFAGATMVENVGHWEWANEMMQ